MISPISSNTCGLIRSHQLRWVAWERHVHPNPLQADTSVPQKCSFGPVALAAWMAAGAAATRDPAHQVFTRIYMDDRTLVTNNAPALLQMVQNWENWSASVGLLESSDKLQLTATSRTHRDQLALQAPNPARVLCALDILGCSAQVSRRTLSPKEGQRCQTAMKALQLIGNLRWPFETFLRAAQQHRAMLSLRQPTVGLPSFPLRW